MSDERLTTYINALDTGNKDYLEELEPVSYTHLDVYKRQALYSAGVSGEM